MKRLVYFLFLISSMSITANAIELDEAIADFVRTWPNLVKISIRSNSVLMVAPSLIIDKSVVAGGAIRFPSDKETTDALLKTSSNGATQFFNVTWIGIFREAYLGIGATPEDASNSGLYGSVFCLPGNGNLYVVHRIHHTAGSKYYVRKYEISGHSLRPVPQALTYLDIDSRVNRAIPFFSSIEMTDQVGVVALGSSVKILGLEFMKEFAIEGEPKVLIVTSSGQVGWVKNEKIVTEHQQVKTALEALDYDTLSDP